jgi:hypothetical protein
MAVDQIQIFLSYARDDDETTPGVDDEQGFVTALHMHLGHTIKQQGHPLPRIWRDQEQIEKAEGFDSRIADAINESELFVVVLSRTWPTRPYCLEELELFRARCEARGWQARERIIIVRTQMVADAECPALHKVTGRTEGYNFFRFNGPKREAGYELPLYVRGQIRHELYHHRCAELGGYLWRTAKRLRGVASAEPREGKTVYLAKPAQDMEVAYLRTANNLMALGHKVLPPPNEDICHDASTAGLIEAAMAQADVSIHLLGEGDLAPDEGDPIVRLQLACAGEQASRSPGFTRIVWAPKIPDGGSASSSGALRDPVAVLNAFDKYLPGDRVLGDVFSGFLSFLRVQLAKLPDPKSRPEEKIRPDESSGFAQLEPEPAPAGKASSRIYIYHKKEDRDFARSIAKWLKEKKKEPILPGMDDDPDRERLHRKYLIDCDAVVLCWAQATDVWAKMSANELRSWSELGRKNGFAYRSLILGPPPGESKSDIDLPPSSEIDWVLDLTKDDQLRLEALMPLLNGMQPSHP